MQRELVMDSLMRDGFLIKDECKDEEIHVSLWEVEGGGEIEHPPSRNYKI